MQDNPCLRRKRSSGPDHFGYNSEIRMEANPGTCETKSHAHRGESELENAFCASAKSGEALKKPSFQGRAAGGLGLDAEIMIWKINSRPIDS
jgi:hypothetical protein